MGSYDLKVKARYKGIGDMYKDSEKLAFTVVINDPCATQTYTIDPSIFAGPLSYTLGDPPLELIFDQSKITPQVPFCPGFVFTILTIADQPLDSDVWSTT